jgi:hypothetical protein
MPVGICKVSEQIIGDCDPIFLQILPFEIADERLAMLDNVGVCGT